MALLRGPLVSSIALVVYFAANVAVRGLHHHPADSPGPQPAAPCSLTQQPQESAPSAEDCAGQTCPICGVLYLAQTLPTAVPVPVVFSDAREWVIPAAASAPHSFPRLAHSRGPPVV